MRKTFAPMPTCCCRSAWRHGRICWRAPCWPNSFTAPLRSLRTTPITAKVDVMTPSRIIAAFACLALLGASTPAQRLAEAERAAAKSAQRIRQLDKAARDNSEEAENYRLRAARAEEQTYE